MIVLGGDSDDRMVRLGPDGAVDALFDVTLLPSSRRPRVLVQPDGRVLVIGTQLDGARAVVRYFASKGEVPVITKQPVSQTVRVPARAVFQVTATGTGPLTYQWWVDGEPVAGATGAVLTMPAAVAADAKLSRRVKVLVVGPTGSVMSDGASLQVKTPPQGSAVQIAGWEGTNWLDVHLFDNPIPPDTRFLEFAYESSGPTTIQWRRNYRTIRSVTYGHPESLATYSDGTPLHRLSFADAGSYSVVLTNAAGFSALPTFNLGIMDASDQRVTVRDGGTAKLTFRAAGPGIKYQWYDPFEPITNNAKFSGAQSRTLTIRNVRLDDYSFYQCTATLPHTAADKAVGYSGIDSVFAVEAVPVFVVPTGDLVANAGSYFDHRFSFADHHAMDAMYELDTVTAKGLPAGFYIGFGENGIVIRGYPESLGTYNVRVTVKNAFGSRSMDVVLRVDP
jgi:hypothetical protein